MIWEHSFPCLSHWLDNAVFGGEGSFLIPACIPRAWNTEAASWMLLLPWRQQHQKTFWFFAPKVLVSSWGPAAQDRFQSERILPPFLTTFSRGGLHLGTRGESLSFLEQGGCSGGRVWFGGSKCPLKNIKVISQIHRMAPWLVHGVAECWTRLSD